MRDRYKEKEREIERKMKEKPHNKTKQTNN